MAVKKTWLIVGLVALSLAVAAVALIFILGNSSGYAISINAVNPVVLSIDNKLVGEGSNFDVKLSKGQHILSYRQPGLEADKNEIRKTIEVGLDKDSKFTIGKNPVVRLVSDPPGAMVFLVLEENRQLGTTPTTSELPPGKYAFKFVLNGKEITKDNISLVLDDEKLIEAFFGKAPNSGVNPNDSFFFSSSSDGVKVCIKDEICGVVPVSFPSPGDYFLKYDNISMPVPRIYEKQHVFCRPWAEGMDLVVSRKDIPWSHGRLVCKGGFFTAEVIGGILRINPHQADSINVALPDYDTSFILNAGVSTVTFVGKSQGKLIIKTYDVYNGNETQTPSNFEAVRGIAKAIQSEDGTNNRYFIKNRGKLYEADIQNLECHELGDIPADSHLRRLGTLSDFYVGILQSNGKCIGARSRKKSVDFKFPVYMGLMPKVQADNIVFYNENEYFGFDTISGEVVWSHNVAKPIWNVTFDAGENLWYIDIGDYETITPVDAETGEMREPVKRADKGNSFDAEKGVYLGFVVGANGKTSVFRNPDNFVVAVDGNGNETWRMQVDDVLCSTGFDTNYDLGLVCVVIDGEVKPIDLSTGDVSDPLEGAFLTFPNTYTILSDKAFYINGQACVKGKVEILPTDIGYLVFFSDGSCAYIME